MHSSILNNDFSRLFIGGELHFRQMIVSLSHRIRVFVSSSVFSCQQAISRILYIFRTQLRSCIHNIVAIHHDGYLYSVAECIFFHCRKHSWQRSSTTSDIKTLLDYFSRALLLLGIDNHVRNKHFIIFFFLSIVYTSRLSISAYLKQDINHPGTQNAGRRNEHVLVHEQGGSPERTITSGGALGCGIWS